MIYTTNFSSVRKLPGEIVPVCISLYPPQWWTGHVYPELAPSPADFRRYKATGNVEQFAEAYIKHTLLPKLPHHVVQDIQRVAGSGEFALVCYEKAESFCHRQLVAYWLRDSGFIVKEWGTSCNPKIDCIAAAV